MSGIADTFFIGGRLANGRYASLYQEAEELQSRLAKTHPDEAKFKLQNRLHTTAQNYFLAVSQRDRTVSTMEHIVSAMGQEQYDISRGKQIQYGGVGWAQVALNGLSAYGGENGVTSEQLSNTIFAAEGGAKRLSLLSRFVVLRLGPPGEYTRYNFAAGVALDAIKLNTDNLAADIA